MFKRKLLIVLALAVCALLLPVTMSAKDQVTRPYKVQGHATMVVDLASGHWVYEEWGEGTHHGRYTNQGSGYTDQTGNGYGSGVLTAANGDQLFWDVEQEVGSQPVVTYTGGTGRFEGAHGGFTSEPGTQVVIINPPTMTITADYTGTGTITY